MRVALLRWMPLISLYIGQCMSRSVHFGLCIYKEIEWLYLDAGNRKKEVSMNCQRRNSLITLLLYSVSTASKYSFLSFFIIMAHYLLTNSLDCGPIIMKENKKDRRPDFEKAATLLD